MVPTGLEGLAMIEPVQMLTHLALHLLQRSDGRLVFGVGLHRHDHRLDAERAEDVAIAGIARGWRAQRGRRASNAVRNDEQEPAGRARRHHDALRRHVGTVEFAIVPRDAGAAVPARRGPACSRSIADPAPALRPPRAPCAALASRAARPRDAPRRRRWRRVRAAARITSITMKGSIRPLAATFSAIGQSLLTRVARPSPR